MLIDLTFGQVVAISDYLGYRIVPGNEAILDTEKNEVIFFGPTCPIDEKLPEDLVIKTRDDIHWEVTRKNT